MLEKVASGFCQEIEVSQSILRLFCRFLMMQQRKENIYLFIFPLLTNMCYKTNASPKI